MRIIWAFNISEAIDPNTKQRIPLSLDMAYFHDVRLLPTLQPLKPIFMNITGPGCDASPIQVCYRSQEQ